MEIILYDIKESIEQKQILRSCQLYDRSIVKLIKQYIGSH